MGIRYIRVIAIVDRYMPFLHIIVLGYGRFQQNSQPCLESLLPIPQEVEVTIFDNGSTDDSPEQQTQFISQHPQIHSVINSENWGFAGGMNAAVNQLNSSCEWLLLVGNDTIFHPKALEVLLTALKEVPKEVALVGPMTNSAGTAQALIALGSTPSEAFKRWDQLPASPPAIFSPLYRADFFCVAIRKSLWDALGGLDRSYGRGYYEDFDFCMRAQEKGAQCVMLENALVFHRGSASFKNDSTQSELIKTNKGIFTKKFPQAQLRHRRLDLYHAIEHDLKLTLDRKAASMIAQLSEIRIESLQKDLPKSPIKKWIWKSKITSISKQLARFKISNQL
jgi:GT2 family glycosyltransferase